MKDFRLSFKAIVFPLKHIGFRKHNSVEHESLQTNIFRRIQLQSSPAATKVRARVCPPPPYPNPQLQFINMDCKQLQTPFMTSPRSTSSSQIKLDFWNSNLPDVTVSHAHVRVVLWMAG